MTPGAWPLLLAASFGTGTLSAVAGFGGGVLLLPIFLAAFGPRDAVAVLTLVQLASNSGRVLLNRTEVDRRLVAIFALGAVPAAAAGTLVLTTAPLPALARLAGAFLLAVVIWRRLRTTAPRLGEWTFALVGFGSGAGSALLGSVGPMVAPFFLARGLVGGAYIGTEAAAALVMHTTKLIVFGAAAALTAPTLLAGAVLTPAALAGVLAGKKIVDRLPVPIFVMLVETGLVASGLLLLWHG
ncbi:MAG: sulfite exporter TauE/SafE family protein [Labedaea sp.]